jgi:hypothetical protein
MAVYSVRGTGKLQGEIQASRVGEDISYVAFGKKFHGQKWCNVLMQHLLSNFGAVSSHIFMHLP